VYQTNFKVRFIIGTPPSATVVASLPDGFVSVLTTAMAAPARTAPLLSLIRPERLAVSS